MIIIQKTEQCYKINHINSLHTKQKLYSEIEKWADSIHRRAVH